jgi:predicted RecA/RadA family phage recombinase
MAIGIPMDVIPNLRTIKHDDSSAVTLGQIILNNGAILIAVNAADAAADNAYVYKGKVSMPKNTSLAINAHDKVYFDVADDEINKSAAGNTQCGYCLEDAASADTHVVMWLEPKLDVISAAGVVQTHIIIAAASFTTAGGDANETITIAGALATDVCHVTLNDRGATPVTILDAQAASGQIDVVMSADPSTDHILDYTLVRAVT